MASKRVDVNVSRHCMVHLILYTFVGDKLIYAHACDECFICTPYSLYDVRSPCAHGSRTHPSSCRLLLSLKSSDLEVQYLTKVRVLRFRMGDRSFCVLWL
jgi:hypothetical protein